MREDSPTRVERAAGHAPNRNGSITEASIRETNLRAILDASAVLFAEKGFDGTRVQDIATRAGIPKANVYYYFDSKEVIYKAIVGRLLAGWDRALTELQPDRAPAEAIAAYIHHKLEYSWQYPLESKLFAGEVLRGAQFFTESDRKHMRAMTRGKVPVIQGWIDAGLMDPIDPRHLFVLIWSVTQFYTDFDALASDALDVPKLRKIDFRRALESITQIVLKGCGLS